MIYKYYINNLHCAGCANKIQMEIEKFKEVNEVNINFYTKTLTLDLDDKVDEAVFFKELDRLVRKTEPGTTLQRFEEKKVEVSTEEEKINKIPVIIGIALFITGFFLKDEKIKDIVLISAYLLSGYDILIKAFKNIFKGNVLDENFLMSIATIGAIILRDFSEAVGVMIFYKIGEYFQELAVANSKKSIDELMKIKPDIVNLKSKDGEIKKVLPSEVKVGDIIVVKAGEKVSLDGVVINGSTTVDKSILTGEAIPVLLEKGDEALSGSLNLTSAIEIRVTKLYSNSTISKIIELIETATNRKAKTEKFITKFSKYYTPLVVFLAVVIGVFVPVLTGDSFKVWGEKALVFLVISCPCALVLSIPLTFFATIGKASKLGILIKGGNYLERLKDIDSVIFDKTGTLTKGEFKVVRVEAVNSDEETLIRYAKIGEFYSNHPIAKAINSYTDIEIDESLIQGYNEKAGYGVNVLYDDNEVFVGNRKYMEFLKIETNLEERDESFVYVALNNRFIGRVVLEDEIKQSSIETIKKLTEKGINSYMLTGDNSKIADRIASSLNLKKENIYSNLLPEEKVKYIEEIKSKSKKGVIFVGDGINDAPALSISDVGISMGKNGSDIAIESSDVVLINDEPIKVIELLDLASQNKRVVFENILLILGIKGLIMILGVMGYANLWSAVFADVGVSIIAVLNSSKILKR